MPEFVLNRNYTLRSLNGHIITFTKGEPAYVPPVCVKEALLIGAEPTGEAIDILDPEKAPPVPMSAAEREEAIIAAFGMLEDRNDSRDFSGNGIPTKVAVEKLVEFDVLKKEIDSMWVAYVADKSAE